jgi:flagellar hook assembly protein FlgD
VTLKIYNLKGQWQETLVNEYQNTGIHQISWDGKNQQGICLPSGIYFGRLTCQNKQTTIKMLLNR